MLLKVFLFSIFYPLTGVIWVDRTDGIIGIAACCGPSAFYLATTVAAAVVAYRKKFSQYNLRVCNTPAEVFFGCLFFWSLYFPFFVRNLILVTRRRAPEKTICNDFSNRKYMILALLWTGFHAFVFATHLPSMLPSRQRYNRSAAMDSLREYHAAQMEFRKKHFADTSGAVADIPLPEAHDGYVFREDPYIAEKKLHESQFGLVAYPAHPRITGDTILWIGMDGVLLYSYNEPGAFTPLTPGQSPLHPECAVAWEAW